MRKVKTIVLKLDFRKAFDMGSWDCLLDVLRARGFDHRRIQIKKGYLLSPLLFIIQVDALQNVIQSFSAHGRLRHSLVPELTCHVI
jgi:hypothetical protein